MHTVPEPKLRRQRWKPTASKRDTHATLCQFVYSCETERKRGHVKLNVFCVCSILFCVVHTLGCVVFEISKGINECTRVYICCRCLDVDKLTSCYRNKIFMVIEKTKANFVTHILAWKICTKTSRKTRKPCMHKKQFCRNHVHVHRELHHKSNNLN